MAKFKKYLYQVVPLSPEKKEIVSYVLKRHDSFLLDIDARSPKEPIGKLFKKRQSKPSTPSVPWSFSFDIEEDKGEEAPIASNGEGESKVSLQTSETEVVVQPAKGDPARLEQELLGPSEDKVKEVTSLGSKAKKKKKKAKDKLEKATEGTDELIESFLETQPEPKGLYLRIIQEAFKKNEEDRKLYQTKLEEREAQLKKEREEFRKEREQFYIKLEERETQSKKEREEFKTQLEEREAQSKEERGEFRAELDEREAQLKEEREVFKTKLEEERQHLEERNAKLKKAFVAFAEAL